MRTEPSAEASLQGRCAARSVKSSLCRNGAQRYLLCLAGPLPQAAALLTCSPPPWPGARPPGRARSGPSAAGPQRSGRRHPRHGRAAGPACCAGGGAPLLGPGPIHPNCGAHGGRRLGPHRALGPPPGAGGLPGPQPWRQQGAAMPRSSFRVRWSPGVSPSAGSVRWRPAQVSCGSSLPLNVMLECSQATGRPGSPVGQLRQCAAFHDRPHTRPPAPRPGQIGAPGSHWLCAGGWRAARPGREHPERLAFVRRPPCKARRPLTYAAGTHS